VVTAPGMSRAVLLLAMAVLCGAPARADEAAFRNFMNAAGESSKHNDHAAAASMYEAAVRSAEALGAPDARLASALFGLGRAKRALHEYAPAEASLQRALGILEAAGDAARDPLSLVLHGLGDLYHVQGRLREAETFYRRELALLEQINGPEHPSLARVLSNSLATIYRAQRRDDETGAAYGRALAILQKALPPADVRIGLALIDLAEWYNKLENYAQAEGYYRSGIPILQTHFPPAHSRILYLLQDWGLVNQMLGRRSEAEAVYKMLLHIVEKAGGERHPSVGAALNNLVGLYETQGRQAEANALRRRMLDVGNTHFRGMPYRPYEVPPSQPRR
jgi:tetratricopeptide (TPR) repeat protein